MSYNGFNPRDWGNTLRRDGRFKVIEQNAKGFNPRDWGNTLRRLPMRQLSLYVHLLFQSPRLG